MLRIFDGPGIWIVLAVVILLFGATRLPALARSIGQSTKIFREEMKTDKPADGAAPTTTPAESTAAPTTAAPTSTPASTAESSGTPPKQ